MGVFLNKKKQSGLVAAVIAVITVVGVGTYNIDLSNQSTNTNEETNISGGTNTFNEIITNMIPDEIVDEATLSVICTQDEIPDSHKKKCEERNKP